MENETHNEASILQREQTNEHLDSLNKVADAQLLKQDEAVSAISELNSPLEAILLETNKVGEKLDEVTKAIKEIPKTEIPEAKDSMEISIKGVSVISIKGDKGESPSKEELLSLIEPLIPEPKKGIDGKDYILTSNDKKEIADSIKVPVVEKIIEKTETIVEKPIITNEIKEVAVTDTPEEIVKKVNTLSKVIDWKTLKNVPDITRGGSGLNKVFTDGVTITGNGLADDPLVAIGGGGSPAGATKDIQFNNAGAFGADTGVFTYDSATNTLKVFSGTVIGNTDDFRIKGNDDSENGSGLPSAINILAGDGTIGNNTGQGVSINAGNGAGTGYGGDVTLQAGVGLGSGGSGNLYLKTQASATPGVIQLFTGGSGVNLDTLLTGSIRNVSFPDQSGTLAMLSDLTTGITRSVNSISTPTTAGATASTDYVYLVSGTTTLTLPTAVGNTNLYVVKNVGVNTVTIATTGGQTIDGSSTITMSVTNTSLTFISDGANWFVV